MSRHWLIILICFLVLAGATAVGGALVKDRYQATSVVVVQPTSVDVTTQLLAYLIPSLEARITGPTMESQVRQDLPADIQSANWSTSTQVEPGTGVMRITVSSEQAGVPEPVADAYASAVSSAASSGVGSNALTAQVIDPASTAARTSERTVLLVSGIALAVLIPLLLAFMLGARDERRDRRRKNELRRDNEPVRRAA